MSPEQDERLKSELSLLESMYPTQLTYDEKANELAFTSDSGSFSLRLLDGYLVNELPIVLAASAGRADIRDELKACVSGCTMGDEILDFVISAFIELAESHDAGVEAKGITGNEIEGFEKSKATVIVWLHHMLNTNKRKQALSPPSHAVSGITKPGYPGVLIYSGPAEAVHEHVHDLKQLNWQAFQIRLESDEEWIFDHGSGVKEFESMKDIVGDIGDRKAAFMEAMRMK